MPKNCRSLKIFVFHFLFDIFSFAATRPPRLSGLDGKYDFCLSDFLGIDLKGTITKTKLISFIFLLTEDFYICFLLFMLLIFY